MTNGAPTSRCADEQQRSALQAAEIRSMLTRNVPPDLIAAAVRCTRARVLDVAAQPPTAPPVVEQSVTVPAPRVTTEEAPVARTAGRKTTRPLLVQPAEPPRATRDRLVRHIAADPVLLAWLFEHNARVIENVADALLVEHGEAAAATALRIAGAHRRHDAPPWGNPGGAAGPVTCGQACDESRGYQAHLRAGEEPCQRSRRANADYKADNRRRTNRRPS